MTPEQRRAKYPLEPVTPLSAVEEAEVRRRVAEWMERPPFTSGVLDITYRAQARLLATLDRDRATPSEGTPGK